MEHKYVETIIKSIINKEAILNPKVDYLQSAKKGEGYIGIVNTIDINGSNKSLHLIIKTASTDANYRKFFPVREAFINEIEFYDEIIPAFFQLQKEHGIMNGFNNIPKCYTTSREPLQEVIIMENLKTEGYDLWDRKKEMNFEHIECVLQQYGRFHANSYALKNKRSNIFERFANSRQKVGETFMETGFNSLKKIILRISTAFDKNTEADYLAGLSKFTENLWDNWVKLKLIDEYAVITHGDCWCNNLMFKYEYDDHTSPTNMRFIDFQLTYKGSPILDLSYFFYACASKEAMDNLPHFQKIYYESLSRHLQEFGCDPNTILPFDVFQAQWKKFATFGFLYSSLALKAMMTDADEAPDFVAGAEAGDGDIVKVFDYIGRHDGEYMRRMKNIVKHFYNNGFL